MSDLSKKLEERVLGIIEEHQYIDGDFLRYAAESEKQRAFDDLKQAFIDDGWVRIPQVESVERWEESKPTEYRVDGKVVMTKEEWERQAVKDGWVSPEDEKRQLMDPLPVNTLMPPNKVMTGQEWYNRFVEGLRFDTKSTQNVCPDCGTPYNWEESAKKVAGIE